MTTILKGVFLFYYYYVGIDR